MLARELRDATNYAAERGCEIEIDLNKERVRVIVSRIPPLPQYVERVLAWDKNVEILKSVVDMFAELDALERD